MNLQPPLTDDKIFDIIKTQLGMASAMNGHKYNSNEELLGSITEEQYELLQAINRGKGQVTTDVLKELVDIAVVCIRGARSYMHQESALDDANGLDGDYLA